MNALGFGDRAEAELEMRTEEAVQNAQIEGEAVSRAAVRSSVARRLNFERAPGEGKNTRYVLRGYDIDVPC